MAFSCDVLMRFTHIFEYLKNMRELSRSCPQTIRWSSGEISAIHHNPHKGKDWLEKSRTVLAKKTVSEKQTRSCLHCTAGWIPDTPSLPAQSQEVASYQIWTLFQYCSYCWLIPLANQFLRLSTWYLEFYPRFGHGFCPYNSALSCDSRSLVISCSTIQVVVTFMFIKFSWFNSVTLSILSLVICWSFLLLFLVVSYTLICLSFGILFPLFIALLIIYF